MYIMSCSSSHNARKSKTSVSRKLLAIRREHPALHRRQFFQNRPIHGDFARDIEWFRPDGKEMTDEDWSNGASSCIGMLLDDFFVFSLNLAGVMECQDPRDKVCALLGLNRRPILTPDYHRPVAEVFTQLAGVLVNQKLCADILEVCSRNWQLKPLHDEISSSLPSRVPDFRHARCL